MRKETLVCASELPRRRRRADDVARRRATPYARPYHLLVVVQDCTWLVSGC